MDTLIEAEPTPVSVDFAKTALVIIDKPGKRAFYQADFELTLPNRAVDTLLIGDVTRKSVSTARYAKPVIVVSAASSWQTAARPIIPKSTR